MPPRSRLEDRNSVLRAIAECDAMGREAFAKRYGFARSARYELIVDGQAYDPKPIVAVAHRFEHGRVLEPEEVEAPVPTLKRLRFDIRDLTPPWSEEEMRLGLYVYLRRRGQRLGRGHEDVRWLSDRLRALAPLREVTVKAKFRNPAGVEQQVGKFLSLDLRSDIEGRGQPSALHRKVWDQYARDRRALEAAVHPVLNELESIPLGPGVHPLGDASPPVGTESQDRRSPRSRPKVSRDELLAPFSPEAPREPTTPASPVQPDSTKLDRALEVHESTRLELAHFLGRHGLELGEGRRDDDELRFDLGVKVGELTWIVEVKSLPRGGRDHQTLRGGLGQLLWYRSRWMHRTTDPCVAVLCVERCPDEHEAWYAACREVSVVLTWPARFNQLLGECAELALRSPVVYDPGS